MLLTMFSAMLVKPKEMRCCNRCALFVGLILIMRKANRDRTKDRDMLVSPSPLFDYAYIPNPRLDESHISVRILAEFLFIKFALAANLLQGVVKVHCVL